MKQAAQAGNRWLADQLNLGTPVAVSHHVGQLRHGLRPDAEKFLGRLKY